MNKIAKYIVVGWFAFLVLLGNTPMDFIHLFANHTDTIHHEHKGLVIEKKHHHCAFLSLTLASFINDYNFPVITFTSVEYFNQHTAIAPHYVQRAIMSSTLRGPPQV